MSKHVRCGCRQDGDRFAWEVQTARDKALGAFVVGFGLVAVVGLLVGLGVWLAR